MMVLTAVAVLALGGCASRDDAAAGGAPPVAEAAVAAVPTG
jgi:hypothetical protein